MLMRNSNTGAFEVYDISNNTITSAEPMGQVGLEWQVAGFGDFSGNANETDMLMRNSNTGAFELYDIGNNTITSAAADGPGRAGVDDCGLRHFSGNANETDMLMRNSNTGVFELYDISNNAITWRRHGPSRPRMVGQRRDGCAARATQPGDGVIRAGRGRARCGAAARTTGDVARCDPPVGSAKRVILSRV